MSKLKRFLLNDNLLVFLFCLAVLSGPAISTLLNYGLQQRCTDGDTYVSIANYKFDHWSGVRRYRIIVPLAASAINSLTGDYVEKLKPDYFYGDFSMRTSFFIVNILLICFYGVVIYRLCRASGASMVASYAGILVMLTCRWSNYLAATPMVDSLYCLVTALVLLGLMQDNRKLLILTIFIGPMAKEAFIFFLPLIFFFSSIPKKNLILYILLSGLILVSYRYGLEYYADIPANNGMVSDVNQVHLFKRYWYRWLYPRELLKLTFNIGIWLAIPVYAWLFVNDYFSKLRRMIRPYIWWFLACVALHIAFGGYDRHFYLAMPVICIIIALSSDMLIDRFFRDSRENKLYS